MSSDRTDRTIEIELDNHILKDKLENLANEYSTTPSKLANVAIRRLIDDVEFYRRLRNIGNYGNGSTPMTNPSNEQT